MEIIISRRVRGNPTNWSFHCHWDKKVFWCLNWQLPMWISQVAAYSNPKLWYWFGFISIFSILFPNHKPCPNSSIATSTESSFKAVTPVHIGTFVCFAYSGWNGDTVHSSKVNDIGQELAPKQWVSAWFSISVANALQITLSWFVCTLIIIWHSPVLMLNTTLFKFSLGTRSASQVFVTRFPRWS